MAARDEEIIIADVEDWKNAFAAFTNTFPPAGRADVERLTNVNIEFERLKFEPATTGSKKSVRLHDAYTKMLFDLEKYVRGADPPDDDPEDEYSYFRDQEFIVLPVTGKGAVGAGAAKQTAGRINKGVKCLTVQTTKAILLLTDEAQPGLVQALFNQGLACARRIDGTTDTDKPSNQKDRFFNPELASYRSGARFWDNVVNLFASILSAVERGQLDEDEGDFGDILRAFQRQNVGQVDQLLESVTKDDVIDYGLVELLLPQRYIGSTKRVRETAFTEIFGDGVATDKDVLGSETYRELRTALEAFQPEDNQASFEVNLRELIKRLIDIGTGNRNDDTRERLRRIADEALFARAAERFQAGGEQPLELEPLRADFDISQYAPSPPAAAADLPPASAADLPADPEEFLTPDPEEVAEMLRTIEGMPPPPPPSGEGVLPPLFPGLAEEQREALQDRIDALEGAVRQVQQKAQDDEEALQNQIRSLERENTRLKQAKDSSEQIARDALRDAATAADERDQARQDLAAEKRETERAREAFERVQAELDTAGQERVQREERLSEAEKRFRKTQDEAAATYETDLEELRRRNEVLSEQLKKNLEQAITDDEATRQFEEEVDRLEDRVLALEGRNKQQNAEIGRLKQRNDFLETERDNLRDEVRETAETVFEVEGLLEDLQKNLDETRDELQAASQEASSQRRAADQLKDQLRLARTGRVGGAGVTLTRLRGATRPRQPIAPAAPTPEERIEDLTGAGVMRGAIFQNLEVLGQKALGKSFSDWAKDAIPEAREEANKKLEDNRAEWQNKPSSVIGIYISEYSTLTPEDLDDTAIQGYATAIYVILAGSKDKTDLFQFEDVLADATAPL